MLAMDFASANISMQSFNEDSRSSFSAAHNKQPPGSAAKKGSAAAAGGSLTIGSNKPFVDHRDKKTFYKDLYQYHENKGTPIARVPRINGQEIDLHKFYNLVIGRGGWTKVNYRNEWEDLVPELELPKKCVNASVALKQIYLRYLDRYEKLNFLGEDNERNDDADDDNRHKKWNNKNLNEVPLKYNYGQHNISEGLRIIHKLSTDLYKSTEYDRLIMSLMSPLPNEQDFAINVCTLMANESKHTLKIENCPKLLEVLLGHAGIYSHFTLRMIFIEFYSKIRRNSLQTFWSDCLKEKPEILELSMDDYYQSPDEKLENELFKEKDVSTNREVNENDVEEIFEDGLNAGVAETSVAAKDSDLGPLAFLNLGRGLGTHDYIGQRVHQIASILRNLTFIDENLTTLIKNRSFIRFLVMCSNIRWGNLHQIGLDMLGNVAPEIELSDPSSDDLTRCILSTISDGLESPDRGVIISSLEILYKLCQKECNEDYIQKCLHKKTYKQICLFLSLNDIMLLLYTLECIYALSSLGEKACSTIVQIGGVIDSLVSLVTVEAQSYGPDGCILMRVVETVPTNSLANNQSGAANQSPMSQQGHSHNQPLAQQHITTLQSPTHQQHQLHQNDNATLATFPAAQDTKTVIQQTVVKQQPSPQQESQQPQLELPVTTTVVPAPAVSAPTPTKTPKITKKAAAAAAAAAAATQQQSQDCPGVIQSPANQVTTKHAQQQTIQENEQFALAWLRATFEPVLALTSRIEQQDLYKMYITASSKVGRTGVVSPMHFPRCVRSVYGGTVGPNQIKVKINKVETLSYYYEGIRIRAKPLALVHKGTILQAQVQQQSTEIVVKKDAAPLIKQNVQPQQFHQPILQQVLSNQTGESLMVVTQHQNNPKTTSNLIIQQAQQQQQQQQTVPQQLNTSNLNAAAIGLIGSSSTPTMIGQTSITSTSSSLIKSLLANKVTATNTNDQSSNNQTTTTATATAGANNNVTASCVITQNVNVHQVAQRQQIKNQKEIAAAAAQQQQQQQTSTIVQNIQVGQIGSTNIIKTITAVKAMPTNPIIPAGILEKKLQDHNIESTAGAAHQNWDPVPPLAPLSHTTTPQPNRQPVTLMPTLTSAARLDEDSNSTGNISIASSIASTNPTTPAEDLENSFNSFEGLLIPNLKTILTDEDSKDSMCKQSQVVTANKMLVDLLDKKSSEPPFNIGSNEQSLKRKLDFISDDSSSAKRQTGDENDPIEVESSSMEDDDMMAPKIPSSNAANLYAKLAASLLEDEDMDDEEEIKPALLPPSQLLATTVQQPEPPKQIISMPMQRQIIVSPNNSTQMVLAGAQAAATAATQQIQGTQATATIKTENGYQTVPVILQHSSTPNQMTTNFQLQKQIVTTGQQILQPVIQQQPQTQYMLATNSQGQTYLVAQQAPQPQHQTVLVTSQQQGSQPTKTIYILQQQSIPGQQQQQQTGQILASTGQGTPQKVIMTTQQGQQMIVTQVPRPVQHQVIMNHPMSTAANLNNQTNSVITTNAIVQQGIGNVVNQLPQVVTQQQQISLPIAAQHPIVNQQHQQQQQQLQQQFQLQQQQQQLQQQLQQQQLQLQLQQLQKQADERKPTFFVADTNAPTTSAPTPPPIATPPPPQPAPPPPPQPALPPPAPPQLPEKIVTPPKCEEELPDLNWMWMCDWRGCAKKKFRSANEVYLHTCQVHCPDNIDPNAEIYCQWGPGPNLCDNLPRKRFSLMTHLFDRHCTTESFKAAVQRRVTVGHQPSTNQPNAPVTIIKNPIAANAQNGSSLTEGGAASPALSTSSSTGSLPSAASAAMQAIKRHALDFVNPKEMMDENEGPVTKSIRLTSALILRNLVNYTSSAKRSLRYYEPHLAGVALSNVESSRTIAQVLYEMNESYPV